MIGDGTTYLIAQTEHTFYFYDSNGWEFIPFGEIGGAGDNRYINRSCFVMWRSPRNETETPQIVVGFNFKSYRND